jgi:hypothetical protein
MKEVRTAKVKGKKCKIAAQKTKPEAIMYVLYIVYYI